MAVIFSASADSHSYEHSSRFVEPFLHWLFPQMSQAHVEEIHHLIRKCGHLTEYAILALLLWRACTCQKTTCRVVMAESRRTRCCSFFFMPRPTNSTKVLCRRARRSSRTFSLTPPAAPSACLSSGFSPLPETGGGKNKNETSAGRRRFLLCRRAAARGNFPAAARRAVCHFFLRPRPRPRPRKIPAGFNLHSARARRLDKSDCSHRRHFARRFARI